MKQFEIYSVSGGTYALKPRPAVIIQSLGFDDFDSITVIPLTSTPLNSEFRVEILPTMNNGLKIKSYAMVEKITTIKKSHIGALSGILEEDLQNVLENKVARFIGL